MGAGAIIGVVTAVSTGIKQEEARQSSKKARRLQAKRRKLDQQRKLQQAVRRAQIERAAILAAGASQGVQGSSAVQGAVGSIQSQTGGSIGFSQQTFALRQEQSRRLEDAARQESITATGVAIGSSVARGFRG